MEEIQGKYIEYLYIANGIVSPLIIGILIINYVYIFMKMPAHSKYHLHLLLFILSFILKLCQIFSSIYVKSFLFGYHKHYYFHVFHMFYLCYIHFIHNKEEND